MSLLAIDRLSVHYGTVPALDDVSLGVAPGEVVALVGRSGSGKSTIAAAALALLPPAARMAGSVRIEGVDLLALNHRGLEDIRGGRVAMVSQEPATALNPALPIGRQIGETIARHTDLSRRAIDEEIAALLARVGLDVAPDRFPHALSGGQRQRVAIAIAIAARPALLIADEPTPALDTIAAAGIVDLLHGLMRTDGMGLLLVSHDLGLAGGIADRIVVLDQGRLVEAGAARPLLSRPRSAALTGMVRAAHPPARDRVPQGGEPLLEVTGVSRFYSGTFQRKLVMPDLLRNPLRGLRRASRWTPEEVRGDEERGCPEPDHAALRNVSLTVRCGETVAVVGESGSGKSTLARLALGLDRPDGGSVRLGGVEWPRADRRQAQAVFQDPVASLDPLQAVGRIVAEPLHLLRPRMSRTERRALVAEALAEVDLSSDSTARRPAAFSGGQRQRIALARALILRPALVVLDEALSALDPSTRADMVALLARLQAERGLAYLFISHDLPLGRAFADSVVVLRKGRVVEQGPVALLDDPRDPYTRALVAATAIVPTAPPVRVE